MLLIHSREMDFFIAPFRWQIGRKKNWLLSNISQNRKDNQNLISDSDSSLNLGDWYDPNSNRYLFFSFILVLFFSGPVCGDKILNFLAR